MGLRATVQRLWYALLQQVARVLFIALAGIRVYHRERLPRTGGVLVVGNHQSYLDPILYAVGMPRPFHPMARDSLFRVAPFRWLIRSLHAFPVKRRTADMGAVREALRRLKRGHVVLMFPEGTRTRDGAVGRMQGGPVTIAARAGVPIVPMAVDGAFEAWPRARRLPRPHPVRVACGAPIAIGPDEQADPEAAMARVRQAVVDLREELRRRDRAAARAEGGPR